MEENSIVVNRDKKNIRRVRKKRRRSRMRVFLICFLIISLITSITFGGYYVYLYKQEEKIAEMATRDLEDLKQDLEEGGYITTDEAKKQMDDAVSSNTKDLKSQIRRYMESGEGTLTMLENLFPANIIVPNSGKYEFFDIRSDLAKTVVDYEKLNYPILNKETGKYEGEATYDGDNPAKKGVDVSKFQGDIDWKKVKNDGVEFAYIRLGYRGYESGKLALDDKYEDNIKGCNEVGIDCGVYFFTEALTEKEAIEEAEFVLENLGDYKIQLPIVIDVEESANTTKTRTKDLTKDDRTKAVIAFCEKIKSAGYTPMIYGNLKSFMVMMNISELEEFDKWFAYYRYPIRFPYKFKIWQYSATRTVDGIEGDADLNLMFY